MVTVCSAAQVLFLFPFLSPTETFAASTGAWAGPLKSSFGLHVVYVDESKPGRRAILAEVRDSVAQEWANERRRQAEEAQLAERLKRHRVRIETQAGNIAAPGRGP
jgi:hypothetical protein